MTRRKERFIDKLLEVWKEVLEMAEWTRVKESKSEGEER